MSQFAYIKLLNGDSEGESTLKINVSQIHKFHEVPCTPFQAYKVEMKPGVIEHATVLFVTDSENEMDQLIKKRNRIRPPNKKYITAPLDTTDSEIDSKKIIKKTVKKSAISDRIESLKRKQENKWVPSPSTKKPKIVDTNTLESTNPVVKNSTSKETSNCTDKERIPFKMIDNNIEVSNCSTICTPSVTIKEEKRNSKKQVLTGKSSEKVQCSKSVALVKHRKKNILRLRGILLF